jgi:hypothetical protein
MPGPPDEDLISLKREILIAIREGDVSGASDALLEVWAHHGIIGGNMAALDRFAVGSGLVQGLAERKRVAKIMSTQVAKILSMDKEEQGSAEPDYAARLNDG